METAHLALEDALRRAVGLGAESLTFFSGVGLIITTAAGQQPLPLSQPLSAQRVRQFHEACLAVAARNDLRWLHYARYWMTFPGIGRFLCEYVERRTTSNLRLQRDPEAPEWVETRPVPGLPRRAALPLPPEPRVVEEAASFVETVSSDDERDSATSSRVRRHRFSIRHLTQRHRSESTSS